eukprot:12920947-Prorocentrum_lima.AAC.1
MWRPWWLPSCLGPVFSQRGSPRCPRAVAAAAGYIAASMGRLCGTNQANRKQQQQLRALLERPPQHNPLLHPTLQRQ